MEKLTARSDLSEKPQDQQNLLRLTDTANSQQRHRINSNRGSRKGTSTNRRETNDESHTINKTNKTIPNNCGKLIFSYDGALHFYAPESFQKSITFQLHIFCSFISFLIFSFYFRFMFLCIFPISSFSCRKSSGVIICIM